MFGSKNGRRVEPRRIPSSKTQKKSEDRGCRECCVSCGNHGWFLTLFCGYVLISSLPRILVILDFIITLALFLDESHGSIDWRKETFQMRFEYSSFDVVILVFIRSIVLFFAFAYRFQRLRKNIYISVFVVLSSTGYLILKLLFMRGPLDIIIFAISFVWIECLLYFMVRRRRVRSPSIDIDVLGKP